MLVIFGVVAVVFAIAVDVVVAMLLLFISFAGTDVVVIIVMSCLDRTKVDLSKLKRHRGAKDPSELEEVLSAYRKQLSDLQGEIKQMRPHMRVSFFEDCGKKCNHLPSIPLTATQCNLTQPKTTPPNPTPPNPTQPNPTQPNPTQPNPTQPNPTQPNPTQSNPTLYALHLHK